MKGIKFHFIGNYASGDELDALRTLDWEKGTVACTRHAWVWPLYCQMKNRGLNVSFSYIPEPDAINMVHGQTARGLLKSSDLRKYFIIGIRADFRPFPYGQFEIVQNKQSEGGRRIYMPHLPQPGLLRRDSSRDAVVNVCFSGRMQNSGINPDKFSSDLREIGCKFLFKGEGHWQDMSDVDILIGIRSLSKDPHHSKPPSKLFNAWLAGIPFIGGYDSAYEQVGTPGENYLRVASPDELLAAVKRLRNDAPFYARLVDEGLKAGKAYAPERIIDYWIRFFEELTVPRFLRWIDRDPLVRMESLTKCAGFALSVQARRALGR